MEPGGAGGTKAASGRCGGRAREEEAAANRRMEAVEPEAVVEPEAAVRHQGGGSVAAASAGVEWRGPGQGAPPMAAWLRAGSESEM